MKMHAVSLVADAGFDTVEASNADEAIAILEARKDIRIVLTDINMPGSMDGSDAAAAEKDRTAAMEESISEGRVDYVIGHRDIYGVDLFKIG
jgi:CheY-like chemotaxis protein